MKLQLELKGIFKEETIPKDGGLTHEKVLRLLLLDYGRYLFLISFLHGDKFFRIFVLEISRVLENHV